MMQTSLIARVMIGCLLLTSTNCNTRPQEFGQVLSAAPSVWTTATSPTAPAPRLARLDLGPVGAIGPFGGTGTVMIDAAAPEGGVTISLQSSAPSVVSVSPAQVTVSPGAFTAAFTFTTQAVGGDASVSISASGAERTLTVPVAVWAVLPLFFSYAAGEPGLVLPNVIQRRTSSTGSSFDAECVGNRVTAIVDSIRFDFWGASAAPVRKGVYDNARINQTTGNRMPFFLGQNLPSSCSVIGRFEVREADIAADGLVNKLWISFEQGCAGLPGTLRGDIRTSARPNNPWRNQCVVPK
jgi:hypothetical protein